MAKLVIFGKHITVEPNVVDMRFDSCFLLAENFPDALDWPSFPREGRRPDLLLLARFRQRCLWLAIRSGTLQRVCTLVQKQHHLQQATEEADSSSKLFLQNLAG